MIVKHSSKTFSLRVVQFNICHLKRVHLKRSKHPKTVDPFVFLSPSLSLALTHPHVSRSLFGNIATRCWKRKGGIRTWCSTMIFARSGLWSFCPFIKSLCSLLLLSNVFWLSLKTKMSTGFLSRCSNWDSNTQLLEITWKQWS